MKKLIIISFTLIIISLITGCKKDNDANYAKGTVFGTISDYEDGGLISNANVKLNPEGITTLTGSDGAFQFNSISYGNHSLTVSKDGYVACSDEHIIEISDGTPVKRDIQLRKAFSDFRITLDDLEIDTLYFGVNSNVNLITYTVENTGTININLDIHPSGDWIIVEETHYDNIVPDYGITTYAKIDRTKLNTGNNIGYIYISSGSLTKTLVVSAIGVEMPIVSEPLLTDITPYTTTVNAHIIEDGGCQIIDKGFEYAESAYYHEISVGPGDNNFQIQIPIGSANYYPRVRAYANNGVYTGYSGWVFINKTY